MPNEISLSDSRTDASRRGFVMTMLASGFALAVQPVSAQTVVTDSQGLTAGEVKIPVKDGEIPGYRAMPARVDRFRSLSSCRKYSAYTNTSRTFAGASPSKAISPLLRSCMPGKAT